MRQAVQTGLERRQFDAKDVDEVILVGGSTRMPRIQEAWSGRSPVRNPIAA